MPKLRQRRVRSMESVRDGDAAEAGARVESLTSREGLAKAHFIGGETQGSNVATPEDARRDDRVFERSGALVPPYDPNVLCKLHEHSNSLRQNVDAYAVNIDANGHRFEPVIDLEADGATEQVRDAIFLERLTEAEEQGEEVNATTVPVPSDAEVEQRIEEMRFEMRLEKARLEAFFKFASVDDSFVDLRQKTRSDKEIMGNGYWEVIRNMAGQPAQFTYMRGFTVRLLPLDKEETEVSQKVKRSPLAFSEVPVRRRFRRFVQVFEGRKVYFKEYGDPRTVSARTGKVFRDRQALERAEGQDGQEVREATEILHFPIHSPKSPYGVPRWIGNLLAVLGSRQAEEVNFLYFDNKSVPPMAVLVSGGRLSSSSVERIESYVKNKIQGRQNFHKIMVIEGIPSGDQALDNATGSMKIEIVPLTGSQQGDALFQKYDERNIDKVGMAFRLPRMLRGDIRDFNRSTSEAALEFAETQVFSPERQSFDWVINRKILPDLNVRFWTFASNAPTTRNPLDLTEIVTGLVKNSILTPEEAREVASGILNRDFKVIEDLWTKIPPELLKKGIMPEGEIPSLDTDDEEDEEGEQARPDGEDEDDEDSDDKDGGKKSKDVSKRYAALVRRKGLRKLARDLYQLREELDAEEREAARQRFAKGVTEEMEREVVRMTPEEMSELFGVEAAE